MPQLVSVIWDMGRSADASFCQGDFAADVCSVTSVLPPAAASIDPPSPRRCTAVSGSGGGGLRALH